MYRQYVDVYKFKGIDKFYDISRLLSDYYDLDNICNQMINKINYYNIDCVCGLDARGFIFGVLIAQKLEVPFYMIRKEGKLPNSITSDYYHKEYESDNIKGDRLCISKIADLSNKDVLIVDDSIATGGTMKAAVSLVNQFKPNNVICLVFLKLDQYDESIKVEYIATEEDVKKDILCIATESTIKIKSIKKVFGSDYTYYTANVPSGVSEQPRGFDEIEKGANFRLNRIIDLYPDHNVAISIENGIVQINNEYFDIACIALKTPNKRFITWSSMVPINTNDVIKIRDNMTIGDIVSPDNPKDPHSVITNNLISRCDILEQAINIAYGKSRYYK